MTGWWGGGFVFGFGVSAQVGQEAGLAHQFGAAHPPFLGDRLAVGFHRGEGQAGALRNLTVAQPLADQSEDLALARGERWGPPPQASAHGLLQLVEGGGFVDHPAHHRLEGCGTDKAGGLAREHDQLGFRSEFRQLLRHRQAAAIRQGQIQDQQIGRLLTAERQGFGLAGRGPAAADAINGLQRGAQQLQQQQLVFHDQAAQGARWMQW